MNLKAFVFDVDGTLADTEETHRQAFNSAFLQFDLKWEWSKPLYRALLKTSGGKERIARFIGTLPVPIAEKARLGQLVLAIRRSKSRFALCADRAEARKPAPDLLIAACERLEVEPYELLYVGDSCADIAAARAAGCFIAVVNYGYDQGHSLPDERPDWLIGSLGDLVALPTTKWLANTEA